MSKDLKPKQKLGQTKGVRRRRILSKIVLLVVLAGGGYAAYRYTTTTPVEVQVARVRRGEFTVAVHTRGEIRSTRSTMILAPQVPNPRITKLADSGKFVNAGDVVVEF